MPRERGRIQHGGVDVLRLEHRALSGGQRERPREESRGPRGPGTRGGGEPSAAFLIRMFRGWVRVTEPQKLGRNHVNRTPHRCEPALRGTRDGKRSATRTVRNRAGVSVSVATATDSGATDSPDSHRSSTVGRWLSVLAVHLGHDLDAERVCLRVTGRRGAVLGQRAEAHLPVRGVRGRMHQYREAWQSWASSIRANGHPARRGVRRACVCQHACGPPSSWVRAPHAPRVNALAEVDEGNVSSTAPVSLEARTRNDELDAYKVGQRSPNPRDPVDLSLSFTRASARVYAGYAAWRLTRRWRMPPPSTVVRRRLAARSRAKRPSCQGVRWLRRVSPCT